MKNPIGTFVITLLILAVFIFSSCAERPDESMPDKGDLVGTYMLEYRELPDGSRVTAPDILGMITFTEKYRNFNVFWKDSAGNDISLSSIAEYNLTEDSYTEKNIYFTANNAPWMDPGIMYDISDESGTESVTRDEGKIKMQLPLHNEPVVTFDEDGFIAEGPGFVDHWKKVD